MSKVVRFESSYETPYPLQVQGESHYKANIENILGFVDDKGVDEDHHVARLILEDTNPVDENAVRVEIDEQKVGYLAKPAAKVYRAKLAALGLAGVIGECGASIKGGFIKQGERADFGVRLDIDLDKLQVEKEQSMAAHPVIVTSPSKATMPKATSSPVVGEKPKGKWKTWQIGAAVVAGLIFCGCAGFWALWAIAKLSGY